MTRNLHFDNDNKKNLVIKIEKSFNFEKQEFPQLLRMHLNLF